MASSRPTVLITGVAGDLGLRLLPQFADCNVIGVDLKPPSTSHALRFVQMDLEREDSCRELMLLLREVRADTVVHLAFVMDQVRTGILDLDRLWHINVAGTARLMEAIGEANRDEVLTRKFIFPSSAFVYGSDLPREATEDTPLHAHTLPYALHEVEAEKVLRLRAPGLRGCSVYILRSHIFAGAGVDNYLIGAFRGSPNGRATRAAKLRRKGKRLLFPLPFGRRYMENRVQFVHVEDMARLIAYIARRDEPAAQRVSVLNVAGRGEPLTYARCLEMAQTKPLRLPGKWATEMYLRQLWNRGTSAVPPEALPYVTGECLVNTERLREFLGAEYERVVRHTVADALADSFQPMSAAAQSAG